jgi:hypothetical protein
VDGSTATNGSLSTVLKPSSVSSVGGFAQQTDVDDLVVQGSDLRCGGHLVDVQVHVGELLPEGAQQAGQDGQCEGGGEADP